MFAISWIMVLAQIATAMAVAARDEADALRARLDALEGKTSPAVQPVAPDAPGAGEGAL